MPSRGIKSRPMSLRDVVFEQLLEQLANGTLSPGDVLDKRAVAEELGVSRTPVREALVLLEANGLISLEPRRGAVVIDLSPQDIEDDYFLLSVVQSAIAKLAVDEIGLDTLARLKGLLVQSEVLLEAGEIEALRDVNWEFHLTLYEATGRPRLYRLIQSSLWTMTQRYGSIFLSLPGAASWRMEMHRKILEACEERDVERVGQLIFDDVMEGGRRVVEHLRERRAVEAAAAQLEAVGDEG